MNPPSRFAASRPCPRGNRTAEWARRPTPQCTINPPSGNASNRPRNSSRGMFAAPRIGAATYSSAVRASTKCAPRDRQVQSTPPRRRDSSRHERHRPRRSRPGQAEQAGSSDDSSVARLNPPGCRRVTPSGPTPTRRRWRRHPGRPAGGHGLDDGCPHHGPRNAPEAGFEPLR